MDLTETERGSTWTWLDQLESLMKVIQGHTGKLSCMSPSVCSIDDSICFFGLLCDLIQKVVHIFSSTAAEL